DKEDSIKMRKYIEKNGIECGEVDEQARKLKDTSTIVVDEYLNTPSYEWPIVFIILKPGYEQEKIMPISASRCIASLIIVEYRSIEKTGEREPSNEEILAKTLK